MSSSDGGSLWSRTASCSKKTSNPAGEMTSRMRAGSGPAFQNVWSTCLGFHTYDPAVASISFSPTRAQIVPSST